jgi:transcription-repair coupling factor (superfamily II helicase)
MKIDAAPETIVISFSRDASIDPAKVIRLIQADPQVKLQGNEKLRLNTAIADPAQRARSIRELLSRLSA